MKNILLELLGAAKDGLVQGIKDGVREGFKVASKEITQNGVKATTNAVVKLIKG